MINSKKIMIQSDFDGTLIKSDISIEILDYFAGTEWHPLYELYSSGRMGLDEFNFKAFKLVKASKEEFTKYCEEHLKYRPGCIELINTCQKTGVRFHIVSNGLIEYIKVFLKLIEHEEIEVAASKSIFNSDGMETWYEDPYGNKILENFKDSYTRKFKDDGYEIIYLGDGTSDFNASQLCDVVFARDSLEKKYKEEGLTYIPMQDLSIVSEYIMHRFQED